MCAAFVLSPPNRKGKGCRRQTFRLDEANQEKEKGITGNKEEEIDMAVITIDGIRLEVPDNKNVLDAALENGIYIPHLCHHKDLNPLGSCRMCIVEVEGQDVTTPSWPSNPGGCRRGSAWHRRPSPCRRLAALSPWRAHRAR